MIRAFFLVFALLAASVASAQTQTYYYAVTVSGTSYGPGAVAADVCPLLDGVYTVTGYTRYEAPGWRNLACYQRFKKNTDGTISDVFLANPSKYNCGTGPFAANGCAPKCPAGVEATVMMDYGVTAPGDAWQKTAALPNVWNGCEVRTTAVIECNDYPSDGHLRCRYTVQNTGNVAGPGGLSGSPDLGSPKASATPSSQPPVKAPDALGCPKGSVQAGMSADGIPLCVGTGTTPNTAKSSTSTTGPEVTTTGSDGSTVKTQDTKVTNADGSVTTTTKTTTTAADGSVTVSQSSSTGATPSGAPGKPGSNGTDGKDAKNICETNPELTMCKNSTVTGAADCAAAVSAVSCIGDAIECAQLRTVATQVCKQKVEEDALKASSMYAKGNGAVNGADPDGSTLPSPSNASSVAMPSSLNTAGFAGAGSPFSDYTFSFRGRSFTIPLAKWSGYLEAFRYVLMVIASLVSFRMLSGAILKDA